MQNLILENIGDYCCDNTKLLLHCLFTPLEREMIVLMMIVVPCTSQRGKCTRFTLCSRKYLLQWRAEKQKSVSHHHLEDSQLPRSRPRQCQAGVKASRSRKYCITISFIIFSFVQLKHKVSNPFIRLV